jgi:hypothetical protein
LSKYLNPPGFFILITTKVDHHTVELSGTELATLSPLVLGGIIENQNSDFVKE